MPIEQVIQLASIDKNSAMGQIMDMRFKELDEIKKRLQEESKYLDDAKKQLAQLQHQWK